MTALVEQLDSAIALTGIAQSLFFIGLLRAEGPRAHAANRWLRLFLSATALTMVEVVMAGQNLYSNAPWMFLLTLPLTFALAPAVVLYLKALAGEPSRRPWLHLFHVPLSLLVTLPILLLPADTKLKILNDESLSDADTTLFLSCILPLVIWLLLQTTGYTLLGWRLLARFRRRLRRDFDSTDDTPLYWMRWIMLCLTGVYGIYAICQIGALLDLYSSPWLDVAVTFAQVLMVFLLGYRGLRTPLLFTGTADQDTSDSLPDPAGITGRIPSSSLSAPPAQTTGTSPDSGSESRSPVEPEQAKAIASRLLDLMTRDAPHLDPLLTLPRLALKTGTTANTLSAVLNQHLGINFFDFVNGYRVDDAARLLLDTPDRTILDIAMEVGFNSKSTFNAAFKKHTGTTPSAWRKAGTTANAEHVRT